MSVRVEHLRLPIAHFQCAEVVKVFHDPSSMCVFHRLYEDLSVNELWKPFLQLNVFQYEKLLSKLSDIG
jgi:hypothetical protein